MKDRSWKGIPFPGSSIPALSSDPSGCEQAAASSCLHEVSYSHSTFPSTMNWNLFGSMSSMTFLSEGLQFVGARRENGCRACAEESGTGPASRTCQLLTATFAFLKAVSKMSPEFCLGITSCFLVLCFVTYLLLSSRWERALCLGSEGLISSIFSSMMHWVVLGKFSCPPEASVSLTVQWRHSPGPY